MKKIYLFPILTVYFFVLSILTIYLTGCWPQLKYALLPQVSASNLTGAVSGCSRIDTKVNSIYIRRDLSWVDRDTVKMTLKNNSNCIIEVITIGKQVSMPQRDQVAISTDTVVKNQASLVLQYKVNTLAQPWAFLTYWPYGDSVFTVQIPSDYEVSFLVKREHARNKLQIAIPFFYEWDRHEKATSLEHLVYFTF
jgi:hypothetical protein